MNKLILIGNGFDLAHGLPTSYNHFIDSFWRQLSLNYKTDLVQDVILFHENHESFFSDSVGIKNFQDFWFDMELYASDKNFYLDKNNFELRTHSGGIPIFYFKNKFFKDINFKAGIEGWVDIEKEYYTRLKNIVKQDKIKVKGRIETNEQFLQRKKDELVKLNNEFEQVKKLLEQYLLSEVEEKYDFSEIETRKELAYMFDILKPISSRTNPRLKKDINEWKQEFSFSEDKKTLDGYHKELIIGAIKDIPIKSFLISFNYTRTVSSYHFFMKKNYDCHYNYIHGILGSEDNKINFGFGDEIDEDYKKIENIGDNEYLKNFKSFQYLNSNNYDFLLRIMDSEKFQVYILGHSCGLSDRVLLNTIFEHENCRSIKVYFYQKENGEDNYTDIVQNISRHFNDKALMRKKIVNKSMSKPLPQNVRFKNKKL